MWSATHAFRNVFSTDENEVTVNLDMFHEIEQIDA